MLACLANWLEWAKVSFLNIKNPENTGFEGVCFAEIRRLAQQVCR